MRLKPALVLCAGLLLWSATIPSVALGNRYHGGRGGGRNGGWGRTLVIVAVAGVAIKVADGTLPIPFQPRPPATPPASLTPRPTTTPSPVQARQSPAATPAPTVAPSPAAVRPTPAPVPSPAAEEAPPPIEEAVPFEEPVEPAIEEPADLSGLGEITFDEPAEQTIERLQQDASSEFTFDRPAAELARDLVPEFDVPSFGTEREPASIAIEVPEIPDILAPPESASVEPPAPQPSPSPVPGMARFEGFKATF